MNVMPRFHFDLPVDFDRATAEREFERWDAVCRRFSLGIHVAFWAAPTAFALSFAALFSPITRPFAFPLFIAASILWCVSVALYFARRPFQRRAGPYKIQLIEDARRREEREQGLRAPSDDDVPVQASKWTDEMTREADWAFGATQQFLPGDIVVEFGTTPRPRLGRVGFAIQRGNRIVAEYVRGEFL